MTTINTTDDIIRLLRENPEFRDAVRRELLTEELIALPQRFSEYAKKTDERMDSLEKGQKYLINQVNDLRGDALEAKMPTRLCDMIDVVFNVRRTQVFWMARISMPPASRGDRFVLEIESATDKGIITEDEEARILRTDMIIRAVQKADGSHLWIAAEASGVIDKSDIDRARQSADALTKVFGEDTAPIVYDYSIDRRQRDQAFGNADEREVRVFIQPDNS
ncbi:MAG: hypothetical protein OXH22_07200 [Chloroflexi bacterium]|nr:hypothetical protein [Chloroflexota bacterium]